MRLGPLGLSVNSAKPLVGVKISKGVVYAPWNATVNVGAFADLHQKQLSGFIRGELDAGKFGVLVADVEGIELQKDFVLERSSGNSRWPEWARASVSVSAGIGLQNESRSDGPGHNFRPRPYLNVDFRPTERNARGAMISMNLVKNQPVDLRPAYRVSRNLSLEVPVTVTAHHSRKDDGEGTGTTRDDLFVNAHLHGVVASVKMDNVNVGGELGESPIVTAQRRKNAAIGQAGGKK